MSSHLSHADLRFRQIMTDASRRLLARDEPPYEIGIRLMGDLGEPITAEHSGGAMAMWGWLTDGIDGPPAYSRGLTHAEIEDLMRQAAAEWLELDLSPESIADYLERWEGWPNSVRA